MKKIIELKVTEICQISQTFLPAFDSPITALLLIIGENDEGKKERVIIPTKEAEFKTDHIVAGERYRFVCYSHDIYLLHSFDGVATQGHLCLKIMDVLKLNLSAT